ncbi:MAG: RagB/SusD family nutrient uptake outer membrane protein [Marinilabiliaceae bacterium]|nr:RagB/SusD family nutrient uptake outer membrane protein [Marinilabiliaceae bacterium]
MKVKITDNKFLNSMGVYINAGIFLLSFIKGVSGKQLIGVILGTIMLVGLTSCEDWLVIKPDGQTLLDDFWQNESQVESALAGCYYGYTNYGTIDRILVWGELRGDNLGLGLITYDSYEKIILNDLMPTNAYCSWGNFYGIINNCNTFLHFAPGVVELDDNFTSEDLRAVEAEALTLRALAYFYLVRAFKDVPLILEPTIDDSQSFNVAKSTERQILDKIIADLLVAKRNAPESFVDVKEDKGRITAKAVSALLADIYLWDGQYNKCIEECDFVLSDGELELEKGTDVLYNVFYKGNSKESIFEIQFDDDGPYNNFVGTDLAMTDLNSLAFPAYLLPETSTSPFGYKISSTLTESEEDKELRLKDFVCLNIIINGSTYPVFKYSGLLREQISGSEFSTYTYRTKPSEANWIIYRLSDVMLMKAEALVVRNGNEEDLKSALKLVNTTYLRSNPQLGQDSLLLSDYSLQSDMEDLVLRERQRELLFEGKRWFDLLRRARRLQDPKSIVEFISPKFTGEVGMEEEKLSNMDALYFPILKNELDANPLLEQNEFYKTLVEGSK